MSIALFRTFLICNFLSLEPQQPKLFFHPRHWLLPVLILFLSPAAFAAGWSSAPALTSPAPGSTLLSSAETFTWTSGWKGISQYQLLLGTLGPGSQNVGAYTVGSSGGSTVSVSVSGIPVVGATLYVELRWSGRKGWQSADYTYTEAGSSVSVSLSALTCGSGSLTVAVTEACKVRLTAAE